MKILIGGCSSIGKSTVAVKLSEFFGIDHSPLDSARKLSKLEIFKHLHSSEAWDVDVRKLVAHIQQMSCALKPVITDWCNSNSNGILEGEGIEPRIIRNIEEVKPIYIIETNTEILHSTLHNRAQRYRKLKKEHQKKVVEMNAGYSKFLKEQAIEYKQPWVYSQPWDTLYDRVHNELH